MEVTSILFEITRQSNPPISQFNRPCHVFKSVWSMFLCNISYVLFYYIDMSKGLGLQVSVYTWRRHICHCCFANVCTNLLVSLYISLTMVHILIYVEYVWVAPCIIKWPMTPVVLFFVNLWKVCLPIQKSPLSFTVDNFYVFIEQLSFLKYTNTTWYSLLTANGPRRCM